MVWRSLFQDLFVRPLRGAVCFLRDVGVETPTYAALATSVAKERVHHRMTRLSTKYCCHPKLNGYVF
ncbi:MAG: hypothetical protein ACI9QL_005313, partial [Candidatus Omnitrophota bacterium]